MKKLAAQFMQGCLGLAVILAAVAFPSVPSNALPSAHAVKLAPHRAIYDMRLEDTRAGSSVSGVNGRMVFEFTGSPCEGYTLNTRLVTQITDSAGRSTTSDLRSSTWEEGKGKKFSFNSSQYLNQQLNEVTRGRALRQASAKEDVVVELKSPAKAKLNLPGEVLFPAQHARAVLDAAASGRTIVEAVLYEGSEKGEKVYQTSAFIGRPLPPGSNKALKPIANGTALDTLPSWPISVSYYDRDNPDKTTPVYQLAYRFYANGVSRRLSIDYGDFSVAGALSGLEFLKTSPCKAE